MYRSRSEGAMSSKRRSLERITRPLDQLGSELKDEDEGRSELEVDNDNESVDKKKTGKKKIRKPKPNLQIYHGTFVHSTNLESVEIMMDKIIGVSDGKIVFIDDSSSLEMRLDEYDASDWREEYASNATPGTFYMPGFVDSHAIAFPYVNFGKGAACTSRNDHIQNRLKLIHDDTTARHIFQSLVMRYLRNGTTTAAYSASHVESATTILASVVANTPQRAFIGLDFFCNETRDDMHLFHSVKTEDVLIAVNRVSERNPRIRPYVIGSRPLPDWLQHRLSGLCKKYNVPFKTLSGDVSNQTLHDWYDHWAHFGYNFLEHLDRYDLLNDSTILVQGPHLNESTLQLVADKKCGMVHCPNTDSICTENGCILRRLLEEDIPVGLGTDGTYAGNISMLTCMRTSLNLSKQKQELHRGLENYLQSLDLKSSQLTFNKSSVSNNTSPNEPLTYKDMFKMATLGGAQVLGMDQIVGNFEVGKEFDALLVDPMVLGSTIDILPKHDTLEELIEKFILTGDDRNITQVFIGGNRVL